MKANINDNPLRVRNIPKRYRRPNGITVDGYDTLIEFHFIDGFRDVITPSYNTETQILGDLIIDNDTITYEVVDLTQDEIAKDFGISGAALRKSLRKLIGEIDA